METHKAHATLQIEGLNEEQIGALTHRIQFGGDEVVQAKDGEGLLVIL